MLDLEIGTPGREIRYTTINNCATNLTETTSTILYVTVVVVVVVYLTTLFQQLRPYSVDLCDCSFTYSSLVLFGIFKDS
jgi:predicted membrane channel-forming protein YqfA (hemolysin III family)